MQHVTERRIGRFDPLVISVEPSQFQDNLINFRVYFPPKYPQTPLRKRLFKMQSDFYGGIKKGSEILAESGIIFQSRNEISFSLFVWPNHQWYSKSVTDEERVCCRGFGKELLCFALQFCLDNDLVNKQCKVTLEAGGGQCDDTPETELMNIKDATKFLKDFPIDVQEEEADTPLKKRRLACAIQENMKLVSYYKRTYGFKVTNSSQGLRVMMSGSLLKVLKKCSE